jgi:hypothetical protein
LVHHGSMAMGGDRACRSSACDHSGCRGFTMLLGGGVGGIGDPYLVVVGEWEAPGRWLISGSDLRYDDVDAGAQELGRGGTEVIGSSRIVVGVLRRLYRAKRGAQAEGNEERRGRHHLWHRFRLGEGKRCSTAVTRVGVAW